MHMYLQAPDHFILTRASHQQYYRFVWCSLHVNCHNASFVKVRYDEERPSRQVNDIDIRCPKDIVWPPMAYSDAIGDGHKLLIGNRQFHAQSRFGS